LPAKKFTIIELPEIDFEKPHPNAVTIEPLFDKIRQCLEHGIRTGIQHFDNEDYACDYLLHAIEESASGKY
jgi:hypothetical protein